jgi:hypothetical protein
VILFLRRLLTPVHLLGRTFLMVHLIGFQTLQKCILSEFVYFHSLWSETCGRSATNHYLCIDMALQTVHPKAHWSPEADYSSASFFIRRMDTLGYVKPAEAPEARLPLIGFIYITSGEVLVEVDGTPFLCQTGADPANTAAKPIRYPLLPECRGLHGRFCSFHPVRYKAS